MLIVSTLLAHLTALVIKDIPAMALNALVCWFISLCAFRNMPTMLAIYDNQVNACDLLATLEIKNCYIWKLTKAV